MEGKRESILSRARRHQSDVSKEENWDQVDVLNEMSGPNASYNPTKEGHLSMRTEQQMERHKEGLCLIEDERRGAVLRFRGMSAEGSADFSPASE